MLEKILNSKNIYAILENIFKYIDFILNIFIKILLVIIVIFAIILLTLFLFFV